MAVDAMVSSSKAKQRLLVGALLFGVCTVLALLSSVGSYASSAAVDHPVPLGPLLRQEFKDWYACGLLWIPVLWFCRRNSLEPGHAVRWVLRHLAAAAVFAVVYVILTSWLVAGEKSIIHPGQILTFSYLVKTMALHYLVANLIMYWMVVCAHLGWDSYQRYREREVQAADLQRELVEARLEALRMQLNPHFLFNTLNTISALIHDDPESADRMVVRLSELLRLSLDQSKPQQVPLSEEIAFLDRYLEIECARFGERLKIEKQMGPDTQTALVPFLLLQPLVENAIRHGIEPRERGGKVAIAARRNNGRLELRIRDNGAGRPRQAGTPPRQGIGLSNTQSRLRHLYGGDFQFELSDLAEGGLEARIAIPYRTEATAA